jgi:hypothetical protein
MAAITFLLPRKTKVERKDNKLRELETRVQKLEERYE